MEAFEKQDVPVAIETDDAQLRTTEAGDMTVAFMTLEQGADFGPALQGLPDDKCQCPHWGYMLKGTVRMHTTAGHQDFVAGEAFYWAPGHAPEALEDSEYVDFSPTHELEQVVEHIRSGAAASA